MNKFDIFYFGAKENLKKINKEYFCYKSVLSDDEIIINTNNIKVIKDNFVLIVGSNKAVYLKDWQVKAVHIHDGVNTFLVKLNRQFFKVYTFKNDFEDYEYMEEVDFEQLKNIAQLQENSCLCVGNGHY